MSTAVAKTGTTATLLTGRQKVAVLCMVLGREATSRITEKLTPDEVEAISYEIARLDRVDAEYRQNPYLAS